MNKIQLHIFNIIKLMFMLVFIGAFLALKIQIDSYLTVPANALLYNFRNMIESLIYSVVIIFGSYLILSKVV